MMKGDGSRMSHENAHNALSSFYAPLRSALNGRPPDVQRPLSRTRLEHCLACGEPTLVKCLLSGISRKSLKTFANCFLRDILHPSPSTLMYYGNEPDIKVIKYGL